MSGSRSSASWEKYGALGTLAGIPWIPGSLSLYGAMTGQNDDYGNIENPSVPGYYDENAALKSQKEAADRSQYGLTTSSGSVKWIGDSDDGTREMEVILSPFEQGKLDAASKMLGALKGSYGDEAAKRAENAVYEKFTNRYEKKFARQKEDMHNTLLNQGIPVGSEAYNRAMSQLEQDQNDAYLNAMNEARLTASKTKSQELSDALSLFGSLQNIDNPLSSYIPGIGTGSYASTYDAAKAYDLQKYAAELQKYKSDTDTENNKLNALGGIVGGQLNAGGSILGMLFSDARIKENIEAVGVLSNGLTVYKFNFVGDPTTRIGLLAQEVEQYIPEAVTEDEETGLLMVDYDLATIPIEK